MKFGGEPKCFCTKSFIQITFKKNYYKIDLRKERENSIILHLKNLLMLFSEVIYFVNSFIN